MKKLLLVLTLLAFSSFACASTKIANIKTLLGHTLQNVKGESLIIARNGSVKLTADSQTIIGLLVASPSKKGVFTIEGDGIPKNTLFVQAVSLDDTEASSAEVVNILGRPSHTIVIIASALDAEGRSIMLAE